MTALALPFSWAPGRRPRPPPSGKKTTTAYRSSPRAQAVVPGRGPAFDPNSPAATGGGSPGYNQNL